MCLGKCLDIRPGKWAVCSERVSVSISCNLQGKYNICTNNRLIYALLSVLFFFIIRYNLRKPWDLPSSDDHWRALNNGNNVTPFKAWYGAGWPLLVDSVSTTSSRKHGWMFKSTHVKRFIHLSSSRYFRSLCLKSAVMSNPPPPPQNNVKHQSTTSKHCIHDK